MKQVFLAGLLAGIGLILIAEKRPFGVKVLAPSCVIEDSELAAR